MASKRETLLASENVFEHELTPPRVRQLMDEDWQPNGAGWRLRETSALPSSRGVSPGMSA